MPKITAEHLRSICREAAVMMVKPGAWASNGLAFDAKGNSADVFNGAVARCGLGWIVYLSYLLFAKEITSEESRKEIGFKVAKLIDSRIRVDSVGSLTLIQLCEQGPQATANELLRIANVFYANLPVLYQYAILAVAEGPKRHYTRARVM